MYDRSSAESGPLSPGRWVLARPIFARRPFV